METNKPRLSAQWLALAAAFLGWMLDGMEQGIFPIIARPALREMLAVGDDRLIGVWMGYLTAFFLLGAAGGGGLFGWLGDKIGRVRAMTASILVYSVFTGMCYFARSPWQLVAFRFIAALGLGGEWALGVALVMEIWPERRRPWLAGTIGAAANAGYALIGVIAFCFPVTMASWRWMMLVGAAPAAFGILICVYVPESARWRESVTGVVSRPLREIFAPMHRRRLVLAIALSSVVLIGTWGSVQWIPLWADKLTNGIRPAAKALTEALLAVGAICGCFAGSWCSQFGRKAAYCSFCLLTYGLCWCLFHRVSAYGPPFLALSAGIGALTGAFYSWLPLYLPELFPTRVRATGAGMGFNFGRILAAAGALGAGRLVAHYDGSYARMGQIITLIFVAGAAVIWLAPETRGKPLPA